MKTGISRARRAIVPRSGVLVANGAQQAVLDTGGIQALGHPDAFLQYDAIDASQVISKDREALFQAKCFKVNEARRIQRTILILVGAKMIGALVKDDLFVH